MGKPEDAKSSAPFCPQGLEPDRELPYVCLGSSCPNCCCGPFHGTGALVATTRPQDLGRPLEPDEADEAASISIFAQIRLLPVDVQRLQFAGLDDMIVRRGSIEEPRYHLRLKPDGTCAALASGGLCSIHHARPTLCRAFPFYVDLFAGLSMVRSCPGVGAGKTKIKDLTTEIESAVTLYRFWLDEIERRPIEDPG